VVDGTGIFVVAPLRPDMFEEEATTCGGPGSDQF
jgi:hypothetical protein